MFDQWREVTFGSNYQEFFKSEGPEKSRFYGCKKVPVHNLKNYYKEMVSSSVSHCSYLAKAIEAWLKVPTWSSSSTAMVPWPAMMWGWSNGGMRNELGFSFTIFSAVDALSCKYKTKGLPFHFTTKDTLIMAYM